MLLVDFFSSRGIFICFHINFAKKISGEEPLYIEIAPWVQYTVGGLLLKRWPFFLSEGS